MTTRRLFGMLGILAALTTAAAQEPKADPKGRSEMVPSTFRSFMVVDDRYPSKVNPPVKPEDRDPRDRTNKMHCLVCDNGLSPVVAVFVRADPKGLATSGVVNLAKAVDRLIPEPEYRADKLAGFVIFLKIEGPRKAVTLTGPDDGNKTVELDAEYPDDEKRDLYATDIKDVAAAAKAPNIPFGLAPVSSEAATAWGIKDTDEVTVVIYNRLRIAKRWTFKADGPSDEQVKEIIAATEKMIKAVAQPKK